LFWNSWLKKRLLADAKLLGRWGEKRTEKYLTGKGFKTLAHNFRCSGGEVDLIMTDHDRTVVFVEVKTRRDETFAQAESAITSVKKARIIRAAKYFAAKHKLDNRPLRFDVVTVIVPSQDKEQIRHYENAFGI